MKKLFLERTAEITPRRLLTIMVEKLLNRTEVVRFKLYTVLAAAREQK